MRADKFLVEKGYYESRARAQAAIKTGRVSVNGTRVKKASEPICEGAEISAKQEHPWVSRGGLKLAHALGTFKISPQDQTCLDVGASTGGFTDVLLSHGATKVYAVDVGRDQLHTKLRAHAQVVSMEGQDARTLTAAMFNPQPTLIVCDASFISACKVLERPLSLAPHGAHLVTLVKPQFEVGKSGIGRGGIVKSKGLALQALSDVSSWVDRQGWDVRATTDSPIKGGSGNHEYLLHAVRPGS